MIVFIESKAVDGSDKFYRKKYANYIDETVVRMINREFDDDEIVVRAYTYGFMKRLGEDRPFLMEAVHDLMRFMMSLDRTSDLKKVYELEQKRKNLMEILYYHFGSPENDILYRIEYTAYGLRIWADGQKLHEYANFRKFADFMKMARRGRTETLEVIRSGKGGRVDKELLFDNIPLQVRPFDPEFECRVRMKGDFAGD